MRKIRTEAAKQVSMNPEAVLDELVSDAQTIIWREVKNAKGFKKVTPDNVRSWIETRITWRLKTHVQRLCKLKYHKRTDEEEARYEKNHPEDIEAVHLATHPTLLADEQVYRRLEDFLRKSSLGFQYKTPIKLVVCDGFNLNELGDWYGCSSAHASAILKTALQRLRDYILELEEPERAQVQELMKEIIE